MNKQYRVKKSKEIEQILNEKKYSSNAYFSIYKKINPQTSNFRYAISVGKKIGNAVIRNRLKRQVHSIVDCLNIDLNSKIDVFVIVKVKTLNLTYQQMYKQLEYLFYKQKLIKGEKNE